ncbi:MAG: hypothetical protein AB2A00_26855 [Myxococcota bacterium]
MFWLLVCLTAAGAFGAGLVWAQGRPRPELLPPPPTPVPALPDPPAPRTGDVLEELFAVGAGDVITHLGADHCVERVTRLVGSDHVIVRADVDGAPGSCIMVLDQPRPWAAVCVPARSHAIVASPPDTVEHQGFRYRRLRRLELREQTTGRPQHLHVYEGPDGLSLFVRDVPGGVEVLEGRAIRTAACQVLPGSRA